MTNQVVVHLIGRTCEPNDDSLVESILIDVELARTHGPRPTAHIVYMCPRREAMDTMRALTEVGIVCRVYADYDTFLMVRPVDVPAEPRLA